MDSLVRDRLGIIACESGKHLAEGVYKELDSLLAKDKGVKDDHLFFVRTKETVFDNSELKTEIMESIRGSDIYIFQDVENRSLGMSTNDNYMALKTAIDAAKRADVRRINVIVPSFPYARQDKQKTREGITAAMVARELEDVGADKVLALDIHNEAIAGFFRKAVFDNLSAYKGFADYAVKKIGVDNLTIASPDAGGTKRASSYAQKLGIPLAIIHKERDYATKSKVEVMRLLGDVKGKKVLLIDDIIGTASTLERVGDILKNAGASEVYFAASLGLFNGPAVDRINAAYAKGHITKVICTNAVFHGDDFKKKNPWYDEVSLDKYLAHVIYNLNKGTSISKLLD